MKRFIVPLLFVVIHVSWAAARENIVKTAAAAGEFRTLVNLLVVTGLDEALAQDAEFTVFAPDDAAFDKLDAATRESLLKPENRDQLVSILKYHVVPVALRVPKQVPSHPINEAKTLAGLLLRFDRDGAHVRVNDANIVKRNIRCSNGFIHVVDRVLLPPDEAPANSLLAVAKQAGQFKTLLAAAEAAGLADALAGDDPLTIFAPTDEAFAQLPDGTLERLLQPENQQQLATILKLHAVEGQVSAAELVAAGKAFSLAGPALMASIRDGRLRVNNANILSNDIQATNGVIHVIDQVLLPDPDSAQSTRDDELRVVDIRANWDDHIVQDGIQAAVLNVTANGGGSVRLTGVTAGKIKTRVNGGASVSLAGSADRHECRVSGGGVLRAADLETSTTQLNVNGGGTANIAADQQLKIKAAAGATVRYADTGAELITDVNKYADVQAY